MAAVGIKDLRTALESILATVCGNTNSTTAVDISFKKARDPSTTVYLVYDLDDTAGEWTQQVMLEIRLITHGDDTTALETLGDKLWCDLDHFYHLDSNLEFAIYRNVRNSLDADDKTLNVRRLLFELRLHV